MDLRLNRAAFIAGASSVALRATLVPATAQSPSAALAPLKIGATSGDDFTPIVYARDAGLFARAGVDVHIDKLNSGAATAAAVASGAYDIGKSGITSLLEAHEKGIPLTLIAPAAVYDSKSPHAGFIVGKDVPLRTGKDFAGQLIGVAALKDIGNVALLSWVEKHGGDPSTMRFVEVPIAAGSAAVQQKRIVAAESNYPAIAEALANGQRLFRAFDGIAPSFLFTAWFTTKDFAAKHPDLVRAFARVNAIAAAYTNTHHEQTAPMIADFTQIPLPVIKTMTRAVAGTRLEPAQIQSVIDVSAKYKMLAAPFSALDLIDPLVRS